jgi:hypothetical protein
MILGAESVKPIYIGLVFLLITLGLMSIAVGVRDWDRKWVLAGVGFFVPIIPIAFLLQSMVR